MEVPEPTVLLLVNSLRFFSRSSFVAGVLASAAIASAAPQYKVEPIVMKHIQPGYGEFSVHVNSINNNGQFSGWTTHWRSSQAPNTVAVMEEVNGSFSIILNGGGTVPGEDQNSYGLGINPDGVIVGHTFVDSWDADGYRAANAMIARPDGSVTVLGTLGGRYSQGNSINGRGQVAGSSQIVGDQSSPYDYMPYRAFRYTPGVGMVNLGTLTGNGVSYSGGMNEAGDVVGISTNAEGNQEAFVYRDGVGMKGLGTLGGIQSYANGINDLGLIVGRASAQTGELRAFMYQDGVGMTSLGANGGLRSHAWDVNNRNEIIGWEDFQGDNTNSFLYSGGSLYYASSLLTATDSAWTVSRFSQINDLGQILADGYNSLTGWRGQVLLNPVDAVPEPGTMAVLSLGALAVLRRRKRG